MAGLHPGRLLGGDALTQTVTLVLSEPGGIHLEAAQALRQKLEQQGNGWRVRQQTLAERRVGDQEDLVVALGVRAHAALLAEPGDTTLFALMLPRLVHERLLAQQALTAVTRAVSALYLDQSPGRQLRLLQQALPQARRVGMLAGPESVESAAALAGAARAAGLEVHARTLAGTGEIFQALDALADRVDVLLLPDAWVVNRDTLRTLLCRPTASVCRCWAIPPPWSMPARSLASTPPRHSWAARLRR